MNDTRWSTAEVREVDEPIGEDLSHWIEETVVALHTDPARYQERMAEARGWSTQAKDELLKFLPPTVTPEPEEPRLPGGRLLGAFDGEQLLREMRQAQIREEALRLMERWGYEAAEAVARILALEAAVARLE